MISTGIRNALLTGCLLSSHAFGAILFQDNFNRTPLQFNANGNWQTQGFAVIDDTPPGASDGNALTFTAGASGGDLFSKSITVLTPGTLTLSFDYYSDNGVPVALAGSSGTSPGTSG